ncbi:MAG: hypothetical protein R3E99_03135 [Burkholderiaceae bacterium]
MIAPHPTLLSRCGLLDAERQAACERAAKRLAQADIERVRLGWCDAHGLLRGKTLLPASAVRALHDGVGMVGTLMLKDHADRTAWKVFERDGTHDIPGFAGAANLLLLPDPDSLVVLPGLLAPHGCAASRGSRTVHRWHWTVAGYCKVH